MDEERRSGAVSIKEITQRRISRREEGKPVRMQLAKFVHETLKRMNETRESIEGST